MSGSGKDAILARIRSTEGAGERRAVRAGGTAAGLGEYRRAGSAPRREVLERFAERVSDYRATVERVPFVDLPRMVATALRSRGVHRLVVPEKLPDGWLGDVPPGALEVWRDGGGEEALSKGQLASCQGVLTGCAVGIADTGTIVLDSGATQGRRAITLLPDFHLCVVFGSQVVETVPEALGILAPEVGTGRMPLTLVSGPSATSDIELTRVEGVHGPRNLWVILVEEEP
jgi:L-lactate dehydrogenase complex protein LldG